MSKELGVYIFPDLSEGNCYNGYNHHTSFVHMESVYENEPRIVLNIKRYIYEEGAILVKGSEEIGRNTVFITNCQFCETKYHPANMLLIKDNIENIVTIMCPKCYKNTVGGRKAKWEV